MRLDEILDDPEDTWHEDRRLMNDLPDDTQDAIEQLRQRKNHKMMGAGINAYAGTNDYENFGDVHRISSDSDGGAIFLDVVASNPHYANNPFLPKVKSIKRSGETQTTIVERLVPFKTPAILNSGPLMKAVWDSYFVQSWEEAKPEWGYNPMLDVASVIDEAVKLPDPSSIIKHPKLIEAVQLIQQLVKTYDIPMTDLHNQNVMWRMSVYSPQLVITDPIAL